MNKLKIIKYIFLPFGLLFLCILFFNILFLDWRYAHKSHETYQEPFNWVSYKFKIGLLKGINKINTKKKGLPKENFYMSLRSQQNLLDDVPRTTKLWQRGFAVTQNNEIKRIQFRYKGDNPANWLLEKKHWRIKSTKENQFGRHRYFDYIPYDLNEYISGKIANEIKLLSPNFNLVELYINDKSAGIYIKSERVNENFLRRNRVMPVNIYKGEQILAETIVGVDHNLFGNHNAWSKVAFFNQVDPDEKKDLINFLNTLIRSKNNNKDFKKLFNKIDIERWVKFAAYQIITQNYHNDHTHNMRLVFDPWTGKVSPIVYDPWLGNTFFNDDLLNLEKSSHNLLLLLNRNSFFIDKKYKKLNKLLNEQKILDNQISNILALESKLSISEKRDLHLLAINFDQINWQKSLLQKEIYSLKGKKERDLLIEKIYNQKSKILNKLTSKPNASWYKSKKGFNINLYDYLPISNLVIKFDEKIPNWVAIDINKNNNIETNEKFTLNDEGVFNIPLTLYSNRIVYSDIISSNVPYRVTMQNPQITTIDTKFSFYVENNYTPISIEYINPFTKKSYNLNNMYKFASPVNKFNFPILNDNINVEKTVKIFTGLINVKKDLELHEEVIIKAGTTFILNEGVSILFKNKVISEGTKDNPISFIAKNQSKPWGTIALHGNKTNNSILNYINFDGGSGSIINDVHYTSMLSLHDVKNTKLNNLKLTNNYFYDDAIHLVYCENIKLDNILIESAYGDAIDIDVSKNIIIANSKLLNPNNDAIDVMETNLIIDSTYMFKSGDKGISVGENSDVLVYNSYLKENKIGIAVKDRSDALVIHTDFENNDTQISNYQKNLQYGDGGQSTIYKSNFLAVENKLFSDEKSKMLIGDSSFSSSIKNLNDKINLKNDNSFDGNKKTFTDSKKSLFINWFAEVNKVKNIKLRGSDFLNNLN